MGRRTRPLSPGGQTHDARAAAGRTARMRGRLMPHIVLERALSVPDHWLHGRGPARSRIPGGPAPREDGRTMPRRQHRARGRKGQGIRALLEKGSFRFRPRAPQSAEHRGHARAHHGGQVQSTASPSVCSPGARAWKPTCCSCATSTRRSPCGRSGAFERGDFTRVRGRGRVARHRRSVPGRELETLNMPIYTFGGVLRGAPPAGA